jgi:hypothetical protein
MSTNPNSSSRRNFVAGVGRLASTIALGACMTLAASSHAANQPTGPGTWDLSWLGRLTTATDRAVFDWPTLGSPGDPIVLEIAERYLDNCAAAYGPRAYEARVVLNIRTQAVPAALIDAAWERYPLADDYEVKDPTTKQPATRNPFWHRAPSPGPGLIVPSLSDLVQRGAIILVCDFALGHLSKRLATKLGREASDVHADLRSSFISNAFAVPSGIFGLAKAQNAGCAYIRV